MKTVVLLPNFGLQAAKLKIFNLEWVIFQEIQTIPIWIKLTKFDDIIQKYNGVIKSITISDDDIVGMDQMGSSWISEYSEF